MSPAKKRASPKKRPASKKKPASKKTAAEDVVSLFCSRCGTTAQAPRGGVPLGWSVGFAGGRLEYLCPGCARANIRAIEGKLPEEWWE